MSEIVIHIGTHKTGTTTLQNTLFHNRALLKARGVTYPRIGTIAPHHNLVTRWIDLPPQFRTRRSALQDWATIARAWAGSDETVLVSSEEFSRLKPTAVDFRELGGLVKRFDRKRVACVIRGQLGFIQSVYVQVTKNQSFVDFDYFVSQCVRSRQATGLALDYNMLLDHVLTGFEPGEVVLIPYEQSVAGEGLVAAFCRRLGLPVTGAELAPLPAGNSNVSPTPLALWLANQAAAPRPASRALIAMAEDLVVAALGPGARTTLFTRGQVVRVRRTFLTANRRFQGRARAIDPDFAMAPLRLHEDTLYRDDIDAPGAGGGAARLGDRGQALPGLRRPAAPGFGGGGSAWGRRRARAARSRAGCSRAGRGRAAGSRRASRRSAPGRRRSRSLRSGWWCPGRRRRPARTWCSGPSCTRASPRRRRPITTGRTNTGCTSTTGPPGSGASRTTSSPGAGGAIPWSRSPAIRRGGWCRCSAMPAGFRS